MSTKEQAIEAYRNQIRYNQIRRKSLLQEASLLENESGELYTRIFALWGWIPGAVIINGKGERGVYMGPRGNATVDYDLQNVPLYFYYRPFKQNGELANKRLVGFGSEGWKPTGEQKESFHAGL